MTAVGLATFLETLDASIVSLALPTLARELNADFAFVQWIILAFVLTQTALMLVVGRLGDVLGKKRIFVAGFAVAGVGALLCGLAPNIYWLIAFRVIQAVGVAMALALSLGIATEAFPASERGRALGVIGGIVSIGIVSGPLLGGVLIDLLSWRWIFFVSIPFALVGIPVAMAYLPESRGAGQESFDFSGGILFFAALLALMLATTFGQRDGYGQPRILLAFALSILFFAIFLWVERRVSDPIVDLGLFRSRLFRINLLLRFTSFIGFVGVSLLIPFYLDGVLGYSSTRIGLMLTVVPIAFGTTAPFAGALADRFGNRPLALIGLIIYLFGFLYASSLDAETTTLGFVLRMIPIGAGLGIFQSPNNSVIMGSVPANRLGMTSGLLSVVRTLGRSTGIGVMGAFWAARTLFHAGNPALDATEVVVPAQVTGLQETFLFGALSVAFCLALLLWEWRQEKRDVSRSRDSEPTPIRKRGDGS